MAKIAGFAICLLLVGSADLAHATSPTQKERMIQQCKALAPDVGKCIEIVQSDVPQGVLQTCEQALLEAARDPTILRDRRITTTGALCKVKLLRYGFRLVD